MGTSVAELATAVARLVGREEGLRLGALPSSDGGTRVVADVTRLRDEVGFVSRHDLAPGCKMRSTGGAPAAISARGGGSRRAWPSEAALR